MREVKNDALVAVFHFGLLIITYLNISVDTVIGG